MTRVNWSVKAALSVIALAVACLAIPSARAQDAAEKTYKAKCVACHGADGKATPTGKKLGTRDFHSPDVQKESDEELIQIVTKGQKKMPAYEGKLSKKDIAQVVAYIREIGKKH